MRVSLTPQLFRLVEGPRGSARPGSYEEAVVLQPRQRVLQGVVSGAANQGCCVDAASLLKNGDDVRVAPESFGREATGRTTGFVNVMTSLASAKMFAVMFAGQSLPMGSNGVVECRCRSTKRGDRTGPLVFSVRCSTN